jgi:hypothetical protein
MDVLKRIRSGIALIYFCIFLIMNSFQGFSQQSLTSFPSDEAQFLSAFELFMQDSSKEKQKEVESFLLDFRSKWTGNFFSPEIKSQIYSLSNKMLAKKYSALPYFPDFFGALIHLLEKNKNDKNALEWIKAIDYYLEKRNFREFSSLLRSSDVLFTQKLIFSDRTLKWKVSSPDFVIKHENDTLKYLYNATDLACYSKGDSSIIKNTSGIYFPFFNYWKGKGGKIDWQRAELHPDSVFAEFKLYSIALNNSKFSADTVLFQNKHYFDEQIPGKLEEQVLASRQGNKAIFPKFTSYEKRWRIDNIFPDLDFTGGIVFAGPQLLGFGDEVTPATISIRRNDTVFVNLRSNNFIFNKNQIRSEYTSFSILHKTDSIYHSGLAMNYTKENKLLSFYREDHGLTANPFYDTFHQIEMYVEAVYWKMDENQINFDMAIGRTKSPARFESSNYYSENRFFRLQGIDSENPLQSLKRYYEQQNKSKIVYFDEYAEYLRMPLEQTKLLLLSLAHQGFLLYDATYGRAILGDKIDFYLKANLGETDSDVIRFESRPHANEPNATLRISDFGLQINGLDRIILSDSQNLVIEPKNRNIVLGKNKDFIFDGKITAGRISLATSGSSFDYDEFKLEMPVIDSLWFWVKGKTLPNGTYERINVKTAIRDLSGDLLIDHPNNKSGLEPRTEYPIFNNKKDSYVYFDKKTIQNGVYTKDKFYFHVNPFTFTSLNDFSTDAIEFQGYLSSAGIFPDIAQPLSVQPDYSLGFTKDLPQEGILAYGGKGKFYKQIQLSNQGLKGKGELAFINSISQSEEFTFLPDSMRAIAKSFEIIASDGPVEFPYAKGSNLKQLWLPYKGNMKISSKDKNLNLYNNETFMNGELLLQTNGLSGNGNVFIKTAKLSSKNYVFKNQTFSSPDVNFEAEGMKLNQFSAQADFNDRNIIFASNTGTSRIDFTENLYRCYMNQAKWYMDSDITEYASNFNDSTNKFVGLNIRQLADTEYSGSAFISLHPKQDSLSFISTKAKFNGKDKIISAEGVHYLKVADAVIFPDSSKLTILKNANMLTFENSIILTNAVTKYHEIDKASVKINGRKSYFGKGDYIYTDKLKQKQAIHFREIKVDTTYQTMAVGEILPEANFKLSPEFLFRGIVNLNASEKDLFFDGGFKIENPCLPNQDWIKFGSRIDPNNILIPVSTQPIVPDVSKQQKFVGLLYSQAHKKNYSAFLGNKTDYYDSVLLTASGFIRYNEDSREFQISSKEKLNQNIRPENYFSLNTENCSNYGEGKINLGMNFPDLKLQTYGNLQFSDSALKIRLGAAIDFHFSADALKHINDQFASTTIEPVDNSSSFYQKMIGGFLGLEAAEQYLSQQLIGSSKKSAPQIIHTLFINDLTLNWNSHLNAYISEGKIGFESIDKYRINALVDGYVAIRKSRFGDELYLYFEINNHWYFFKNSNNVMQVLSSNENFNELIRSETKSKDEENWLKKKKKNKARSNNRYILSRIDVKDDFLKQINKY